MSETVLVSGKGKKNLRNRQIFGTFFDMSHIFSRKLLVIGKFQSTFAPEIEN